MWSVLISSLLFIAKKNPWNSCVSKYCQDEENDQNKIRSEQNNYRGIRCDISSLSCNYFKDVHISVFDCFTFNQTDIEMIAFLTLIVDLNHLDLGVHSEVYLPYRKIKSCKNLNKCGRVVLFPSNGHRFCL